MFIISELLRPPIKLRERALLVKGGGPAAPNPFFLMKMANYSGTVISSDTHTLRIKLETGSLSHGLCVFVYSAVCT